MFELLEKVHAQPCNKLLIGHSSTQLAAALTHKAKGHPLLQLVWDLQDLQCTLHEGLRS